MKKDDDQLRLSHILDSINKIERFTEDIFIEEFESNEMMQDAIIKNFEIIGEAATRLSKEFKQSHDHIPWQQIQGLRHRLVHDYYKIDLTIVWNTIQNRLPILKEDLEAL